MKVELLDGSIKKGSLMEGEAKFYELSLDNTSDQNMIRVYLNQNLQNFGISGNFIVDRAELREEPISRFRTSGPSAKFTLVPRPTVNSADNSNYLIAGMTGYIGSFLSPTGLRLDRDATTGTLLQVITTEDTRAGLFEGYLANLNPGQLLATQWFKSKDNQSGSLKLHRKLVVNADGKLKRLKKVNEADWEKIASGDFSELLRPRTPFWRRILSASS